MKQLIAFHGQQAIKEKYVARVQKHRELDQLVKGETGGEGKGCAVWCTLDKYQHSAYETELGIPRAIAKLEDVLFERLPQAEAMEWPGRFLSCIEPGADLNLVMARWFVWLLTDPQDGVIKFAKTERTRKSIQKVSDLYARKTAGEDVSQSEFKAADADASASAAAADADASASAADADASASAAYAAAYAADADASAYAAAYAAYADAGSASYKKQAEKLLEYLAAAPKAIAA